MVSLILQIIPPQDPRVSRLSGAAKCLLLELHHHPLSNSLPFLKELGLPLCVVCPVVLKHSIPKRDNIWSYISPTVGAGLF